MSRSTRKLLEPADLVRAGTRLLESSFVEEYGDVPWLAITLPAGGEGLAAALHPALQDPPVAKVPLQMEFQTHMEDDASLGAKAQTQRACGGGAAEDLVERLGDRCFFAAVRKRLDAGGALGDRVSVGRALNKDLVLRHGSISKFHAYLQRDRGTWSVTDAGSTNGTMVEGARLGAKESRRLVSGERVTFGSIRTVFLDARAVYQVLRAARTQGTATATLHRRRA